MTSRNAATKRGQGYSIEETLSLLDILEQILPIGSDEWETVLREHHEKFSEQKRDVKSLKRKFGKLYCTQIPTGDPNCPPEVFRAKHISRDIRERAECDNFDDMESDEELENPSQRDDLVPTQSTVPPRITVTEATTPSPTSLPPTNSTPTPPNAAATSTSTPASSNAAATSTAPELLSA
eukprot:CAMPEP_0195285562 /NCGR_PEP_ID=MMETSP0707-20130614/3353_1 /TAXON_ID=33640 /ORGANISM="Asterionellopsis glacialis, Strain CCMP134" /LENGTH=179 /DNA_ID=CAMNT_0040345077 /DNA_START=141 /DNA_END=676 /DNA_ORIENTATION=+